MKYKTGDVVLVKMIIQNKETFGGYSAILAHASRLEQMDLMPGDIFALVSRKPKKEKPVIRAGGYFVDHPEEAKGAFQPDKLDMGEPVEWNALPSNPSAPFLVKVMLSDGTEDKGYFFKGGWYKPGGYDKFGVTVIGWKELDK